MKSAVYGYDQSGKDEQGKRTSFRYFGHYRSFRAFVKALLEIEEIKKYGNWNWISERAGETGNIEEIRIALEQRNKIFRYEYLKKPNTAIVVHTSYLTSTPSELRELIR
ncbi:hypothetical protein ES703_108258 [subsurface metagenome]